MRVLQLTGYFYPEKVASIYLEENHFGAFGNAGLNTIIYTPTPTRGISPEERRDYKKRKLEKMYDGHVEVHRFCMFAEGKNPVIRALRYTLCWIKQFNRGLFAKDIDCIYLASTPPIQGLLGGLLRKLKSVPFVYNLQDIFPDSLTGSGLAKKADCFGKLAV